MTCDGCATSIEKRLQKKAGILEKKVSYPAASGTFTYDETKISKEEIIQTINTTGHYQVVGEMMPGKQKDTKSYDLIILGGGSAAFAAAIKAESLGLRTLMVNAGLNFGGTCVNVGCVPSKTLIRTAETIHRASHSPFSGVKPKGADIDFARIIKDEKALVATLQQKKYLDVVHDFKNLDLLKGWAEFTDEKTIRVNGKERYTALKFLIATGARTRIPAVEGLNETGYLTNISLFGLEEKPESLTILGAGYIGCEMAMAYNRFGIKVRIIEFTERVLRSQMPDISEELEKQMKNEGIEILPGYQAVKFEKQGSVTLIRVKRPDGTLLDLAEPGKIVVATGITANTEMLKPEKAGVKLAPNGHVAVNDKMETNIPHIYAAGDVADTPAYVYTAAFEGKIAVENAFTGTGKSVDYSALPWVVFTDPQVAGAGLDEAGAKARNIPYEVSKVELKDVPRALAARDTRGFIKLIRHTATDKLIGARIVAPEGGELIQALSMAIKYGLTVTELAENLYPYLTLGEGIKLAALTFGKDIAKLSCCAS